MSDACPTVRIVSDVAEHEGGFIVINEADFDSATQTLFAEPEPEAGDEQARALKPRAARPKAAHS